MQITKLLGYATFGSTNYYVEMPLLLDSEMYNKMMTTPHYYDRTYSDLSLTTSPASLINAVFNTELYSNRIPFYTVITSENTWSVDDTDLFYDVVNLLGLDIDLIMATTWTPPTVHQEFTQATKLVGLAGNEFNLSSNNYGKFGRVIDYNTPGVVDDVYGGCVTPSQIHFNFDRKLVTLDLNIWPEDILLNGYFNATYADYNRSYGIHIVIFLSSDYSTITKVTIESGGLAGLASPASFNTFLNGAKIPETAQKTDDMDNPYGDPGTSGPGGGDGDYGDPDEVDPTAVPDLPTISASSTGFITIYNPTSANLSSLGNFLWSNLFDIDTFKKLYADPMDCIISLGIVPCIPTSGGTQNIKFGNVDTGINCSFLSTQYAKVDCGSVDIRKYVGSFMDYSPYVKISLFLPYIGFINLGTDDIMGGSINVTYHVDILSGDCIAFITHSSKGVLYSYTGNCLTNVPITAANYANSLRNYYEAVTGIIPSTCNGAASGGAAGAASGAINGALSAASNIILNTKPDYQRSGSLGGSSGIMGVQKPFIVIERPNISVPNKVQHYMGQMSNITANLGGLSGMTIVEAVHLEGVPATTEEIAEIESMLKAGVIL